MLQCVQTKRFSWFCACMWLQHVMKRSLSSIWVDWLTCVLKGSVILSASKVKRVFVQTLWSVWCKCMIFCGNVLTITLLQWIWIKYPLPTIKSTMKIKTTTILLNKTRIGSMYDAGPSTCWYKIGEDLHVRRASCKHVYSTFKVYLFCSRPISCVFYI